MLRLAVVWFALTALSLPARAEDVWMVKSSTPACQERDTLAAFDASGASRDGALPPGCVLLLSGERLMHVPQAGRGFDDYVKLQRHDYTEVFVRNTDVVPDPGIGSVYDER